MNDYKIVGDYVELYVTHKGDVLTAYIDKEDLPMLINFGRRWFVNGNKRSKNTMYLSTVKMVDRKRTKYFLHRFIANPPSDKMVDHINGNGLDNRKSNLRFVNQSENVQNKNYLNRDNTSGFRGVGFHQGKWRARIRHDGKELHLGSFDTADEANEAVRYARATTLPYSLEAREGNVQEVEKPKNRLSLNSKAKVTGVIWNKRANNYIGRFMYNRKSYYVGSFNTIEEAKVAVESARANLQN